MKNALILLLLALPITVFCQSKSIENFFSKYKNHESTTTLTFGGGLIKFAASFEEEGETKILDKISQVRLMVSEGNLVTVNDYKGFTKSLKKDAFEDLMQINAEGTKVDILIRENGNWISDVIILVDDEEDFIMISVEGNFQYSDLNDINLNFEGGEYLKKLPEKRKSIPRA
jgi:hypothetical protein